MRNKHVLNSERLSAFFEKMPRLFSVIFYIYIALAVILNVCVDKKINKYYVPNFLKVSNVIVIACSVIILLAIVKGIKRNEKKKEKVFSQKQWYCKTIFIFGALYIVQLIISYCIYFRTGWDVSMLVKNAENIALYGANGVEEAYFSTYPNNLVAVYTLVFFYKIGNIFCKNNPYIVLVAANNLIVNLSVLLSILCVYKIEKRQSIAVFAMVCGSILIVLSPWIVIPYTDTLGMIFPVGAVFAYLHCEKKYLKYFLFTLLTGIGYLYKPTIIILLIAMVIIKMLECLSKVVRHTINIKMLLQIGVSMLVAIICMSAVNQIVLKVNKTALDENKSMVMTHYFMMGLNTDYDGVFSEEDVNYSKSFSDKESRQEANLRVIKQRYHDMGLSGYLNLLCKKTLANYDDGTFSWSREGGFYQEIPERTNILAKVLRKLYYWNLDNSQYQIFAFIEQVVWFLVLLSISCCILKGEQKEIENFLALTLLGVSLFLLLFECRARYLFVFSPLFIILASMGLRKICCLYKKKSI